MKIMFVQRKKNAGIRKEDVRKDEETQTRIESNLEKKRKYGKVQQRKSIN